MKQSEMLRFDGGRRSPKGAHITPDGSAYVWRCHGCKDYGRALTRNHAIEAYISHLPPAGESAHVGQA